MQALEKEEYERRDFVSMLKNTEANINRICDRADSIQNQRASMEDGLTDNNYTYTPS